jgi:hypothetical protein
MPMTLHYFAAAGILSDSFGVKRPWKSPCAAVNAMTVLKEYPGGADGVTNDEGRAMAELICFVAPGEGVGFRS